MTQLSKQPLTALNLWRSFSALHVSCTCSFSCLLRLCTCFLSVKFSFWSCLISSTKSDWWSPLKAVGSTSCNQENSQNMNIRGTIQKNVTSKQQYRCMCAYC